MVVKYNPNVVILDGNSMSCDKLVRLSQHGSQIEVSPEAWKVVMSSRSVVTQMLDRREVAYGINTGFGLFSNVIIDDDKLELLQQNLIRSHSAGVGEPLTYGRTRMLLALRINVLCRGNSGVSVETLKQMVDAFNAGCASIVPAQGTVGASGDLAPLSHLALGLMGEGLMWVPPVLSDSPEYPLLSFRAPHLEKKPADEVLSAHGLRPIQLGAKEGLALINGTQMITALGCEALVRARNCQRCSDVIAALTLEVLKGTVSAFHPMVHERRAHKGQGIVAARLRALLHPGEPSELFQSHKYQGRVQDAYSLRCTPQIHGVAIDTINFVESILEVECNSSTDNPMVFTGSPDVETVNEAGEVVHLWPPKRTMRRTSSLSSAPDNTEAEPEDLESAKLEIKRLRAKLQQEKKNVSTGFKKPSDTFYDSGNGFIVSGGNFHGEYPAKALDFLGIAVSEIASVSERRIERLVNPSLSGLPAFLVADGGLNSGFMISHCCAAGLVSENKVLCHPSSVDSISTSGAKEDHVSMGGFSARKAISIVENVEKVLAIELLAACQGLHFHRPLKTTEPLEAVVALVREKVPSWDSDRIMNVDIDIVTELINSGQVWKTVKPFLFDYEGTDVSPHY